MYGAVVTQFVMHLAEWGTRGLSQMIIRPDLAAGASSRQGDAVVLDHS